MAWGAERAKRGLSWLSVSEQALVEPCTGYLGYLFYNMPLHVDEQHG